MRINRVPAGLVSLLLVGCAGIPSAAPATTIGPVATTTTGLPAERREPAGTTTTTLAHVSEGPTVSVLLVGDVMLGRGVAPLVRSDPTGVFEDVRHVVTAADFAAANLESPLTFRAHIATNPFALEADPASAGSLAGAGFDLMGVANNHAGDAGRLSVIDTIEAVEAVGLKAVGGGANLEAAYQLRVVEIEGINLGFLAFDATMAGTAATSDHPGIASWDEGMVRSAVESARGDVDVLVVGVHGGVEYYGETDPGMAVLAGKLAGWGADVVWGHGAHVMQPVYLTAGTGGRATVIATSLGNFLFDQSAAGTRDGALLEVLVDEGGVVAYRVGSAGHHDRRVHFDGWALPEGDAVLLGLDWWNLVRSAVPVPPDPAPVAGFPGGDIVDSRTGDATGDGREDLVISHRRPFQENEVNIQYPDHQWADAQGRSAHLGVYQPESLRELWVAGTLFRPVATIEVCDGSVALAFDSLDDPTVVATGGWVWQGFGFTVPAELVGTGRPGCIDVDGDGRLDPVIVNRS